VRLERVEVSSPAVITYDTSISLSCNLGLHAAPQSDTIDHESTKIKKRACTNDTRVDLCRHRLPALLAPYYSWGAYWQSDPECPA